jgi:uncharacterized protein (TIGR00297 family)
MFDFIIGLLLSTVVSIISIKKSKLTFNAGLVAIIIGTLTYGFGGWQTGAALFLFFASATVTSRFKKRIDSNSASKARKVSQVLANGLPAVTFAMVYFFTANQGFLLASISAIACATADTWSSDIGVISKRKPVSILTLKPIETGQSGGISLLGCFCSVLGSALIAGVCVSLFHFSTVGINAPFISFIIIALCGTIGSLVDSILGASVQAKYRYKNEVIEDIENHMEDIELISGVGFFNNDIVNLSSAIIAGGLSLAVAALVIVQQ